MRWPYIFCSFFLLLVGSYLDNVRGPLLPLITRDLALSYAQSSWFLIGGNFAAVICTVLLIPFLHRWGERKVVIGICIFGMLGGLFVLAVHHFVSLLVLATVVGSTVAMLGAMSNVLTIHGTDLFHRARAFCGLHVMYGLGSLMAPAITALFVENGFSWSMVILSSCPLLFLAVGFVSVVVRTPEAPPVSGTALQRLTRIDILILATFAVYVAGEVMTSMWMVTYLVESQKIPIASAARYLMLFFSLMGLTRALCFLSLSPRLEKFILYGSLVAAAFFFILGHKGNLWAFGFAGILGPYFPLFLARVSRTYHQRARSLTLWILTWVQLTLAFSHLVMGRLTDRVGIERTYWVPLPLMLVALGMLYFYLRQEGEAVPASL